MPIYEYVKSGKTHYYYAFEVKEKNGKRKTLKKRGFKTKKEARSAEAERRVEWESGMSIDPSKMTFGQYITDWLANKNDITPETRYTNEGHLRNHIIPELGNIKLQSLDVGHIESFISTLKKKEIAQSTIRKIFNLMQTCLKSAHRKQIISKNPTDLMDRGSKPKVNKPNIDYWTKEEVKTFFSKLKHRQKLLFVLAIYCGMRRGEILGLRWRDIDLENRRIHVRNSLRPQQGLTNNVKTASGYRSITFSEFVKSEIIRHKEMVEEEKKMKDDYRDQDLVICQRNGDHISVGNFTRMWKYVINNTEMRYIRFHDLRHTCASLLLSAGVHPKVVQELLGHSSIKVTMDKYSHLMPNMQAEAADTMENLLN
ncbi:tyrosine-type recombinase/integrase [Rossellomorea marisflavi]|uniref:site-specific integrase n=1 Tax=Rossellomorea marisflavi TaxID=189381 RepID=UPI003F9F065E